MNLGHLSKVCELEQATQVFETADVVKTRTFDEFFAGAFPLFAWSQRLVEDELTDKNGVDQVLDITLVLSH